MDMARLNETRMSAVLDERIGGTFMSSVNTVLHAAHATTVIVGLDADVEIVAGGEVARGRAVVVPPDELHHARCAGPAVSFTFDPELAPSIAGFARERGTAVLALAIAAPVHASAASLARPDVLRGVGEEVAALLDRGAPIRADRRVARIAESLREGELDRATLAATHLSPAHLRALFVRDIGVPIRTYVLWRRLLHALARIGPCDYTTAAHGAGFADLAHFSRTCRRMLGYAPSHLQARLVNHRRERGQPGAPHRDGLDLSGLT